MTSSTSIVLLEKETSGEALVHRLKLQWVMTRSEPEKRGVSEEIRRRLLQPMGK